MTRVETYERAVISVGGEPFVEVTIAEEPRSANVISILVRATRVPTEEDLDVGSRIAMDCDMCGIEGASEPAIALSEDSITWPPPHGWGSLLRPDKRINGITPSDLICPTCARKVADAALGLDGRDAGSCRVDIPAEARGARG